MAAVGQVKAHEAPVRPKYAGVHGEVRGTAGQRLDIHAPALGAQVEGGQRALDAELLDAVDVLIAAVIPCANRSLTVFVGSRAA